MANDSSSLDVHLRCDMKEHSLEESGPNSLAIAARTALFFVGLQAEETWVWFLASGAGVFTTSVNKLKLHSNNVGPQDQR